MRNVLNICKIGICGLMALILFGGCATANYNLRPVTYPNSNQQILYIGGTPVMVSQAVSTDIAAMSRIQRTDDFNQDTIMIHLGYLNKSDHIIDIDPSMMKVVAYFSDGKSAELPGIPPDKFLSNLKLDQNITQLANAISAAVDSYNDAQAPVVQATTRTYSSGTYTGSGDYSGYVGDVYTSMWGGHSGYSQGSSIANTDVYDRRYTEYKDKLREEKLRSQQEQDQFVLQQTGQGILRRTSLMPGKWIEGDIMVKYKKAERYVIHVPAGDHVHVYELVLSE